MEEICFHKLFQHFVLLFRIQLIIFLIFSSIFLYFSLKGNKISLQEMCPQQMTISDFKKVINAGSLKYECHSVSVTMNTRKNLSENTLLFEDVQCRPLVCSLCNITLHNQVQGFKAAPRHRDSLLYQLRFLESLTLILLPQQMTSDKTTPSTTDLQKIWNISEQTLMYLNFLKKHSMLYFSPQASQVCFS